jgi:hypothetical protein
MIKVEAIRNGADEQFIGDPMRTAVAASDGETPVTATIHRS